MKIWTQEDNAKLVACKTDKEIVKAFPNLRLDSLKRRRRELQLLTRVGAMPKEKSIDQQLIEDRETSVRRHTQSDSKKKLDYALEKIEMLEREKESILALKSAHQSIRIEDLGFTGNSESVAFAIASDWHIEETVVSEKVNHLNEYNLSIARRRAVQFFQNTLKLLKKEQVATKIDTLVLALLGDFISGNIHEELLENCSLQPMPAIIEAKKLLVSGIKFLLENSDVNLVIPCHVGNHTRITKKVHISTEEGNSLEYFMYHVMADEFAGEPRVKFLISEGYLSYLQVYDFTVRFHHGHAIKFGGGIGGVFIPAYKKISQWEKAKHANLDVYGHLHQVKDGGNFLLNGSLIGYNAFAIRIGADYEPPKQLFFLVSKKRGKTVVAPITFDC